MSDGQVISVSERTLVNGPSGYVRRSSTGILHRNVDRRTLLRRCVGALMGGSVLAPLTGCGPVQFAPNTPVPDPDPVETPAQVPDPPPTPSPVETPAAETTPTPAPEPTPTPEPIEQVLRISGTFLEPTHLSITEPPECLFNPLTSGGLTRINAEFEIEPDWSDSWERLEDRAGWRFRVVVNTDGWSTDRPVTAHDFVEHWLALLDPESGSPAGALLGDIENALAYQRGDVFREDVGIVAIDEFNLEVSLIHNRETFPTVVSSMALRPGRPADLVEDDPCAANGRFFETERVEDETVTLQPFDGYWDISRPGVEQIQFSAVSPGIALTAFRQGEIDLLHLSGTDVIRVPQDPLLSDMVVEAQPERVVMLVPNFEMPPFDRVEVRRALSLVIDRRRLEQIVEGRVMPATRFFPTGMFSDLDDAGAGIMAEFDVDQAYSELRDSDLANPDAWPSFGLDIPSGIGFLDRVARDVAAQFRENLDIQVPIRVHDPDEFAEGIRERRFALAWLDWRYPYADPASTYLELFASWRGGERPLSWSDPEYDELLRAADDMGSPEDRAVAWAGCEGLLQEHAACIVLAHPREFYLLQPNVEGLPRDGRDRLIIGDSFGLDISRNVEIAERPDE